MGRRPGSGNDAATDVTRKAWVVRCVVMTSASSRPPYTSGGATTSVAALP